MNLSAPTPPRGRTGRAALVLALVAAALLACQGPTSRTTTCRVGSHLVPTCGVLLGVTPPHPDRASLLEAERVAGRRFALVYAFHDINDQIPSSYDRAVVDDGRVLHIDIDSRDYSSPDPDTVSWSAVAAGDFDRELVAQAQGIAGLGRPVFVTFDHEPNQPTRAALGPPEDFVAAWRHVHELFAENGATNAVWVWVVMSWPPALSTALRMWPGNEYVDWISWDAYNSAGCRRGVVEPSRYRSFSDVALPFLTWLQAHGPAAGIDVDKPLMISEVGTIGLTSRPTAQADWFRSMAVTLADHPQIKAVTLWDHEGSSPGCDFRFAGPSGSLARIPWTTPSLPG